MEIVRDQRWCDAAKPRQLRDRLLEQRTLRPVQLFAARGELPPLEQRHLVGELLDLELLVPQLVILAGQCFDQAGGEFAQLLRIHARQLIVYLHVFDTATAHHTATAFSRHANRRLCTDATPRQADHQRL